MEAPRARLLWLCARGARYRASHAYLKRLGVNSFALSYLPEAKLGARIICASGA